MPVAIGYNPGMLCGWWQDTAPHGFHRSSVRPRNLGLFIIFAESSVKRGADCLEFFEALILEPCRTPLIPITSG
jgi:hypothetical protein